MKISDAGLDRIKGYEGYMKALPDGRCAAYQDKFKDKKTGRVHVDKPTIGWGCTEGVEMGMIWTKEQAEARLLKEIAKHESALMRMVTVDVNQNQIDALLALSYNIGSEALKSSTTMKKLNAGDNIAAAKAFSLFNKAGGIVLSDLVSRRASEAGLFLRAMPGDDRRSPQTVTASKEPMSAVQAVTAAAAGTASVGTAVKSLTDTAPTLPSIPSPPTAVLEQASAWKGFGLQVMEFGAFAAGNKMTVAVIVGCMAAALLGPKLAEKWRGKT